MGFDFEFKLLDDEKELKQLEKHLIEQPFDYPHYEDWVEKAISEIDWGYKKTILAFSDGIIVGNGIFQPHKTLPKIMEFKNMRIHPALQGRYFGFFIARQVEAESKDYDAIICDTRSDRLDVLNLLKLCGYREIARALLYDSNTEDVVLLKNLNKSLTD
ncbi:MAG: hypothetical protein PHQ66_01810 [Candidatus Nanoarchaeia archaeon]|nr:hypothetical protein [Candidatus Nanoarchaeia archaeon]MDD5357890.1 hypothetical protein [Candidatus Nanoarchaeia archaeon]MDD5588809.1 hypothetical protein [Candidatus Nanoarchaeia archaeon]